MHATKTAAYLCAIYVHAVTIWQRPGTTYAVTAAKMFMSPAPS